MKHNNHKTVFVSLLTLLLLVSFSPPLKKTKKVKAKPMVTYLPKEVGAIKSVTSQPVSLDRELVSRVVDNTPMNQNLQSSGRIDSVVKVGRTIEHSIRLNEIKIIQPIPPLPVKLLRLDSKSGLFKLSEKLNSNVQEETASSLREYYKYDSTSREFEKTINKKLNTTLELGGFDPVRFTLSSNKDSVNIGEEIEIKITVDYLDVSPSLMFQFEGSNAFTLKMLFPDGFIKTGGTYYDYMQGKVDKANPKQEFTIKGVFEAQSKEPCFSLLRSFAGAGVNDIWEKKEEKCIYYIVKAINKTNSLRNDYTINTIPTLTTSAPSTCGSNTFSISIGNCLVPSNITTINDTTSYKNAVTIEAWNIYEDGSYSSSLSVNYATLLRNSTPIINNNLLSVTHSSIYFGCSCMPSNTIKRKVKITCKGNNSTQEHTSGSISGFSLIPSPPTITPESLLNGGVKLTVTGCVGGLITWEDGSVFLNNNNPTPAERIVNPSQTTTYSAICTLACQSTPSYYTIIINPCGAATPTITASGLELTANGTCTGGEYKWYKNYNTEITPSSQIITGELGNTYQVRCFISESCKSSLSDEITLSSCNVAIPTINEAATITIPTDQTTTLSTSSSCLFEGINGTFEWYKDDTFYSDQSHISAGVGCYKLRCRINDDCYSTFTSAVCVKNNNCGDFTLFAYSNATARQCGVSVGEPLILYGGIENGITPDEIQWWFAGSLIPNSNSGTFTVKQLTTLNDSGEYTLKVKKNGIWCETKFTLSICPCNFSASPMYSFTGNVQSGTTTLYSSNNCPTCTHIWTLPNGTTRNVSGFSLLNNERMNGVFTLSVTKNGCVSGGNVDVRTPLPPSYNSVVSNAFCDNVSGSLRDTNNPGLTLGSVTLEYKNMTTNVTTIKNIQPTNYGYFYFPWTLPPNITYQVKVKDPSGNYIGPYQNAPAIILCCTLAIDPILKTETVCNTTIRKGRYVIYLKGHSTAVQLQYRLLKKTYNSNNESVYQPTTPNWSIIPVGTAISFLQFTDLERGFYQLEIVEGTNPNNQGCKINTNFVIDCVGTNSTACGTPPLITAIPDKILIEGGTITPTLIAEPMATSNNTSAGLGNVAVLSGANSIQLGSQDGTQSNTFEAWIKAENNSDITVGYIGAGEKHRKLMQYWGKQNPFYNTLSVGSNGVTLIEDIPTKENARRVAISFTKILTGWNHIALVYRNHIPEIYINGKLEGKATQSIYTIQNVQVSDTYDTQIGYTQNLGFIGSVDEIRLWYGTLGNTSDLTAATISQNLKSRDNVPVIGTGKYWAFEEIDPLKNVSGSNYDKLKFEENVQIRATNTSDDKLPQSQDYKWYLNGVNLATKSFYTTLIDQLKPDSQTYVLHYTGDNGVDCQTSKTIKIRRCLSISPNTTQIVCEGTPVTLTATGNVGSTFTWYKVGKTTALATTATFAVPTNAEGNGIYYAKSSTCNSESDKVEVKHVVIAKPTVLAIPNPATAGRSAIFKGNYIGDTGTPPSYLWTGPNNFVSSFQNPELTNLSQTTNAGIYTLTITQTANNLTCNSTATTKLLINAASCGLTVGTDIDCVNNLGKISVVVIGNTTGRTIQYSINNGEIWQSSNIFTNLLNGDYDIAVRSNQSTIAADQITDSDYCYVTPQQVIISCATVCSVQKKLNYDRWDNIEGTEIGDFTSTQLGVIFNQPKTVSAFAPNRAGNEPNFDIRNGTTPNFIARMRGFICPPVSGTYTFYMKADNSAKLFINGSPIIWVHDNPNNHDQEVSGTVTLIANTQATIEVHHKQGISASFVILSWQAGSSPKVLVSADYLSPTITTVNPCQDFNFTLTTTPNRISEKIVEGTEIKAIATATNGNSSGFVWTATDNALTIFDAPKGITGAVTRTVETNIPVYLRPALISSETGQGPFERKYKVAFGNAPAGCYQEVTLNVIKQTCDCPTNDCDNVEILNPSLVTNFGTSQNFVAETVYLDESASTGFQTVTYFDGLGRPKQKINIHAGPEQQDMVQPIEYDAFGRMPKNFLPYPVIGNNGNLVANATTNVVNWYQTAVGKEGSNTPFTQTTFEASPLSRPTEQVAIGNDKLANKTEIVYGTNAADIKMFTVSGSSVAVGTYPVNTLYKTQNKEVAVGTTGNLITVEYKDKEGRVVCKDVGGLRTYYVYNDLGQLVCVVPPKAIGAIIDNAFTLFATTSAAINELIFAYEYNDRGLMVRKKIPSSKAVMIEYYTTGIHTDMLMKTTETRNDLPLITRIEYDDLNRPLNTYVSINNQPEVLVMHHDYDEYPDGHPEFQPSKFYSPTGNVPAIQTDVVKLKGLEVSSWSLVTNADGNYDEGKKLITTTYFDTKNRPVQVIKKNYGGGNDINSSDLDFVGRVRGAMTSINLHGTLETKTRNGYDYGGRNATICQKIDNGSYSEKWQPIARYNYNDIGEMVQKTLGCRMQVVDYEYNISGWLSKINNPDGLKVTATKEFDFFGMKLGYTGDGNINQQIYANGQRKYLTNNNNDPYDIDQKKYTYTFGYDTQKRLLTANMAGEGKSFNLLMGAYDVNGNITTLNRTVNGTPVDNLGYNYANNTNLLTNVTEGVAGANGEKYFKGTANYAYYLDGSLKNDDKKGATFTYSASTLPAKITGSSKTYEYIYDAAGGKLQTKVGANTYEYAGNAVYLNNILEFVGTPEGRWLPKEQLYAYVADRTDPIANESSKTAAKYGRFEYILKDHLSNSRVACRCVEKPTATTTTDAAYLPAETLTEHYEPWGASIAADILTNPLQSINTPQNRFTYNGKELQTDIGLFEYGFRWYDPMNARFTSVDPLSNDYAYKTPYDYAENEPIAGIDLDGAERAQSTTSMGSSSIQTSAVPKEQQYIYTETNQLDGFAGVNGEVKMGVTHAFYDKTLGIGLGLIVNVYSVSVAKAQLGIPSSEGELFTEKNNIITSQEIKGELLGFGAGLKSETTYQGYNKKVESKERVISIPFVEFSFKEATNYVKEKGQYVQKGKSQSDYYLSFFKSQTVEGAGVTFEGKAEVKINSTFFSGGGKGYIDLNKNFVMHQDNTKTKLPNLIIQKK
ncbi:DUF6443 domain-containing protein [Emticicia aquatica]|nr:DUF6443 domain-containing protein [Emticicia aquatica]